MATEIATKANRAQVAGQKGSGAHAGDEIQPVAIAAANGRRHCEVGCPKSGTCSPIAPPVLEAPARASASSSKFVFGLRSDKSKVCWASNGAFAIRPI